MSICRKDRLLIIFQVYTESVLFLSHSFLSPLFSVTSLPRHFLHIFSLSLSISFSLFLSCLTLSLSLSIFYLTSPLFSPNAIYFFLLSLSLIYLSFNSLTPSSPYLFLCFLAFSYLSHFCLSLSLICFTLLISLSLSLSHTHTHTQLLSSPRESHISLSYVICWLSLCYLSLSVSLYPMLILSFHT